MQGNRNALAGIDILRKVCNHPDLLQRSQWQGSEEYGSPERSGKLTVAIKVCLVKPEKPIHKQTSNSGSWFASADTCSSSARPQVLVTLTSAEDNQDRSPSGRAPRSTAAQNALASSLWPSNTLNVLETST